MLVDKLGVDALLLMLCRPRFCKSFQSANVYYDLNNSALLSYLVLSKSILNPELVLVVKVQFLYVIHQVDY